MKATLEGINFQYSELNDTVDKLNKELERSTAEEQEISSLIIDAEATSRLYVEYLQLTKEVEDEEKKLLATSSDTRTLEEVKAEYDALRKESEQLNQQLDALRKESQKKQEDISKKEVELIKLKEETMGMKGASEEVLRLKQQIEEIQSTNENLKHQITEWTSQASEKIRATQELNTKKQSLQKEYSTQDEQLQLEKDTFQSRLSKVESLEQQLLPYVPSLTYYLIFFVRNSVQDITTKMEQILANKKEAESKLAATVAEIKANTDRIDEIRTQLSQREINRRNIAENIRYRQQLASIKSLEASIKEKEQALKLAAGSVEAAEQDLRPLEKEFATIKSKYDRLIGARANIQDQIKGFDKELNKAVYKTVDDDHRKMLIEVTVQTLSTETVV